MRITSLARRSAAVLASTALLTTGLTGLTMGQAYASHSVSSVSKTGGGPAINNAISQFAVQGSGFRPANQEEVRLKPTFTSPQSDIVGTDIAVSGCGNTPPLPPTPNASCTGPLTFNADLRLAAPGIYDVAVIQRTIAAPDTSETATCFSCLQIFSAGAATVSSSARTGTTDGPITLTGTNFARGATVVFYNTDPTTGASTTPDPALQLSSPTITSSTSMSGTYTASSGAGGHKIVRVFNLDDPPAPGPGAAFVQPRVNSLSPSALGQGANSIPVTVTGAGFDGGTTASWTDATASGTVTVAGPLTASNNGATLAIPTSVSSTAPTGSRTLILRGTGGAFTSAADVLTVTPGPKPTQGVGNRGQGGTSTASVSGTGFTTGSAFAFGPDITATTLSSTTSTLAQLSIAVGPDAVTGTRVMTVTNPDKGISSFANGINVTNKPVITTVTPSSAGTNRSVTVNLGGFFFDTTGGVTLSVSGTGITVVATTVNSSTSIRTTFNIASGAQPGPRDITIVNNTDQGRSTCPSCFGINSLTIEDPDGATNNGPKTLVFNGSGLTANTVLALSLPGSQTYQSPIVGDNVTCPASAAPGTICAVFDLENRVGHGIATGRYSATATTGSTVLTCTSCFPIVQVSPPTVTGLSPASGGQGATDRSITITGTNFSPGETVTFDGTGITTSSVTWDSPTKITAVYSIASNAITGTRGLRVTNIGDGSSGASSPTAFTVTAAPTTTSTTVSVLGQNAVRDVTLTGTNYDTSGAVADFGPGTASVVKTRSATSLVVTVSISDTADTAMIRDIRVTNPDGGTSVLAGAFRVTPAPRITSIAPDTARAGETKAVTISGSGFNTQPPPAPGVTAPTTCPTPANGTCPTVTMAGAIATVKTVSADGTSMTADFAINANAPISNPAAKVTNPDHGNSTKLAAFRIATVPVAPTSVAAPSVTATTANLTWAFPTTTNADGGSPITSFVISDGDASTSNDVQVGPSIRAATIGGLTSGKAYTFAVRAVNAVGTSAAGVVVRAPGSTYTPLVQARIFDRTIGSTPAAITIAGFNGVPSNATAVALNVEVLTPAANGYVRVTPFGSSPNVATQRFYKGKSISNLATVKLISGKIQALVNTGSARVLIDVVGYYQSSTTGSTFSPLVQDRIFDRTIGTIPSAVTIAGFNGVPSNATAVALNVEVLTPAANGYVRVTPFGSTPNVATQRFYKGKSISNQAIVKLVSGKIQARVNTGTARVLMDVAGYYSRSSAGSTFTPLPTVRIYNQLASTTIRPVFVTGVGGVPANAKAVVLNTEVIRPSSNGYTRVTTFGSNPNVATQRFYAGTSISNLAIVKVASGKVQAKLSNGTGRLLMDVSGFFA